MNHLADRIVHATTFVIPVGEYWVKRELAHGSIIKDRSDLLGCCCVVIVVGFMFLCLFGDPVKADIFINEYIGVGLYLYGKQIWHAVEGGS